MRQHISDVKEISAKPEFSFNLIRILRFKLARVKSDSEHNALSFFEESLDAVREAATLPAENRVEAEARRLEALGARRVRQVRDFLVMEAPTGQRFCVLPAAPGRLSDATAWP